MEVAIQYLGESRFSAQARGHTIIADQPYDNGGTDTAMAPSELLLASLGTCTGYYAAQYLRARDLPAEGLKLTVRAEKGAQPARFSEFQVTVSVADLEERHADALLRAIKACMVHHTLQHQPHVRFEVLIETPSQLAVES